MITQEVSFPLLTHPCFQREQEIGKPLKGSWISANPVEVHLSREKARKQICPSFHNVLIIADYFISTKLFEPKWALLQNNTLHSASEQIVTL